jgi:hypothetical protein
MARQRDPIAMARRFGPIAMARQRDPIAMARRFGPIAMARQRDPIAMARRFGPIAMAWQRDPIAMAHPFGLIMILHTLHNDRQSEVEKRSPPRQPQTTARPVPVRRAWWNFDRRREAESEDFRDSRREILEIRGLAAIGLASPPRRRCSATRP